MYQNITMNAQKHIALIAHDNKKKDLLAWVKSNKESLKGHVLYATGTTGKIISEQTGLEVNAFKSGPLGGDQQIGCSIVEGKIDFMIFFWDPLESQPHDPDVKALLRIAALYNIPVASNLATADFLFSSPLMNNEYNRLVEDYSKTLTRNIKL